MRLISKNTFLTLIAGLLMVSLFACPALGQRRGSFGGGRSFGGGGRSFGGFSRSSGGGSFGGGRSSFGGGGSIFGGSSRPNPGAGFGRSSSGSSSFSRSGHFGASGRINSSSVNAPPSYRGVPYTTRSTYFYGGRSYPYYGYGGYGDYWFHPSWYYWLPFHPAFYYGAPYEYQGAYYPGGFSFTRLIIGILVIVFIFWLLGKLFGGGGGRGVKYTSYR
jgi:hypothetical protein